MARPRAFDEATALQKALETFWYRGYSATSVEDLVAGTGLSRASLYATFGDKHALFLRALGQYQQQAFHTLTALAADPAVPAAEHVRQVLELTAGLCQADAGQRGCFMVNTITELVPHDPEVQALAAEYQHFLETLLATVLRRGQQRGEVRRTAAPQAQARLLVSVLNGMRVMAKADADPQLLRDVVDTALLALA
ncbi:TetR/AcrR family transcriptional regulator [Hymenobacter sp. PAMC 26628]|uniref:TetR/AcrR family transcriptional regulator n=1 Tax=Hymenobacter sp. PAMC 26628 TaxID=1484118 RepID=UPI00076FE30F|nr:TetR/AcrR family transcriptional regulator [Hymenobacter sp. PAMC 26628]AMJ65127.1 hypothetical protein AXW84_06585 [Hymenobacter sp. PAMC 26628]